MLIWKSLHKNIFFSICFFYEVNPWIAAGARFLPSGIFHHILIMEKLEPVISGILAS
jgi:hypothetical protein